MTEAMPFLQKTILLSYDPRPSRNGFLFIISPCNTSAVRKPTIDIEF